ncbi:MAG: hypothetical protein ACXVCE_10995 [Bacteriovorax sp.]
MELCRGPCVIKAIDPIDEQLVEVHIEIDLPTKALDQGDGSSFSFSLFEPCFFSGNSCSPLTL